MGLLVTFLVAGRISANYLVASGQRYTPIQGFGPCLQPTANGEFGADYYDQGYIANFAGFDTARPFLGNLNAPATSVGIYAGDACNLLWRSCTIATCPLATEHRAECFA